jgi:hypothetical protein
MQALVGEEILTAWERSRDLPEQKAVLAVLALVFPESPVEELAGLPLGERNSLLLELRAMTLGQSMEGFAVCPECGAQLEFALDARELAKELHREPLPATEELAGYTIRPANTLDLLAASAAETEEQARSILLTRTVGVKEAEPDSGALAAMGADYLQTQPAPVAALLVDRFEQMNASSEIRVQLQCAVCYSRPWLDLDIAHFLLREIAGAARRLMMEIHELASAYGWSERSIAAMSATRRAAYLEMLST